jgi:hypothetical protein
MRHLRLTLVSTGLALLLGATLVVPAFGGPDPLQLAEKALDRAKRSDKTAKSAKKTAKRARKTAKEAKATAAWALRATAAGPPLVYITRKVTVQPLQFGDIEIRCPPRYSVSGSAMSTGPVIPIAEAVASSSTIFSGYNASATPYSYYAHLQCIRSVVTRAAASASQATREVAEAKRAFAESR